MIALRIEDKKKFTSELFVGELFDRFFLREAVVVTFNTFTVDGRDTLRRRSWSRDGSRSIPRGPR